MDRASMPLELQSRQPADSTVWTRVEGHADRHGARRSQHLALDAFSPVNENGSFEFDRVLKSGKVLRRSKNKHSFKPSWKPCYMVLRPNLLSVYKDEDEARLQMSIAISDISAVALVKAPKSKRPNVFGIFSPSKNYRFQAASADDAESWVHQIRSEFAGTYSETAPTSEQAHPRIVEESGYETSDPEGHPPSRQPSAVRYKPGDSTRDGEAFRNRDYCGNDIMSCSELSDTAGQPASFQSSGSFGRGPASPSPMGGIRRDTSQHSNSGPSPLETERVIYQGYLQCLRTTTGVKQWKKLWVVLRPYKLYFYKDHQEYLAILIIPMDQVISAAEIDPISRSKPFCFQVITEDKTHRFAAPDEETLDRWLGSLTSVLVKLKRIEHNPVPGAPLGG
ncbi:hypothetical protein VTO42DRAFT_3612 [Malbranchea cinnamomea]